MSVQYDIFPELNLLVYVCAGNITPTDFFAAGDQVALDPRFQAKMKIIIDFWSAELETEVSDLQLIIQKHQEAKQRGQEVGQTAILTTSIALKHLGDVLSFLSLDTITNFGIFHAESDVANWLKLPVEQALQCWSTVRGKANNQP